jgi:NAD+ diphosphatase
VIVAVIKKGNVKSEDKLLLVRNNYGSYRRLALVAGFVEIGESFEQAVHREVMEEVGLKVKNLRYYKNQPWGLSYAQMIGFTAELDGEDEIKLQENELSEGGWYTRDEVPNNPFSLSVGNEMIHSFGVGEL